MQQYLQNKKGLVEGVFNQVYSKYDLMNDFMSLGVHRFWKKSLINMMNPSLDKNLIDVACGTGDIGKLYLDSTNKNSKITCVDPNKGMVSKGKNKLISYKNINWLIAPAEKLPIKDNSCDYYTISFGLRNTKDLNKALSEAYRVLKPGGRYLCLEFSKINNAPYKLDSNQINIAKSPEKIKTLTVKMQSNPFKTYSKDKNFVYMDFTNIDGNSCSKQPQDQTPNHHRSPRPMSSSHTETCPCHALESTHRCIPKEIREATPTFFGA